MIKLMIMSVLTSLMLFSNGCASYLSYQASHREIVGNRVASMGDESAIRAFAMGDTVGIGINVLAYEAITEHPFRQLGAAILDAGAVWAISEGIKELEGKRDRETIKVSVTGDRNYVVIIVDGEGHVISRDTSSISVYAK